MKTTALTLALVLLAPLSLSAAPLKGNFLLTADLTVAVTPTMTFSKGRASLVSNAGDNVRINAEEMTVDQSDLVKRGVTVITFRGVTAVSSGLTIPPSKELTLELDSRANLYRLNPAGIVQSSVPGTPPTAPAPAFSTGLPKLDLTLRATTAPR